MRYLVVHRSSQRLDGHLSQVALGMTPYRDRPVGLFLFAGEEEYRYTPLERLGGLSFDEVLPRIYE